MKGKQLQTTKTRTKSSLEVIVSIPFHFHFYLQFSIVTAQSIKPQPSNLGHDGRGTLNFTNYASLANLFYFHIPDFPL